MLMKMLACLVLASSALAQQAPEGNAHPQSHAVSASGMELGNPFGKPDLRHRVSTEVKSAFAEKVDLEPLRRLAVQHDGRVKILDTLARESVVRMAGRKTYLDYLSAGAGKAPTKISYDPLFTYLDVLIDPGYYLDKPLIYVEFLPLRRAFVEAAIPEPKGGDKKAAVAEQERWLMLTRLSPGMIATLGERMQNEYDIQAPYRDSLMKIAVAMDLFTNSAANLLMIAPAEREAAYTHLSSLPEGSPIRTAAAAMGEAWRAGDAAKVNATVRTLAAEPPKINPHVYPGTRRDIEWAYNTANAFEFGFWAYGFALVALLLAFGTGRKWLIGTGVALLGAAVLLHGFGFVTRCIIAERFAIQNQFESMTGLSLFGAIVGMGIMLARRQWLFGAAAAGVGFLVLITATQTAIPGRFIEREAAILNTSVLLKYHVTTVLCSYGLITLGFIVSLFYLGTHYTSRRKASGAALAGGGDLTAVALNLGDDAPKGPARMLSDLDKAQLTVLQLAFWTLGVGILLGAWWADHSWGRWWAFDPKETWALVTWIIYLIVIHVRIGAGHNRGLVTAWLSVLGFIVMLWTYFGVNLILPGLHAYA